MSEFVQNAIDCIDGGIDGGLEAIRDDAVYVEVDRKLTYGDDGQVGSYTGSINALTPDGDISFKAGITVNPENSNQITMSADFATNGQDSASIKLDVTNIEGDAPQTILSGAELTANSTGELVDEVSVAGQQLAACIANPFKLGG